MSLTNKEAMQALLDGKILKHECLYPEDEWNFRLDDDGHLIDHNGEYQCFRDFSQNIRHYNIYEEPKKKKKVTYYKYYYTTPYSNTVINDSSWVLEKWETYKRSVSVGSLVRIKKREFEIDELN